MGEIQLLQTTTICGFPVKVYGTPQEPMFLAKDVAEIIEHQQVSRMVELVDDDEKLMCLISTSGQNRQMWFLTENGLYEVLMQSRKPIAKEFKKGVKAVLKEIRTKGGYIASSIEETPEMIMAKALQVAQATIERHQQQLQMLQAENKHYLQEVKVLSPKAEYTDKVLQSASTYTLTQVAKEFGYTINGFTSKMKELGVMYKQSGMWMLTSKFCGKNYTSVRTHQYYKSDGTSGTNSITVFTELGRAFLHALRNNNKL